MEIIIIGWHLLPFIFTCNDCEQKAAFVVARKEDEYYGFEFNLCEDCAHGAKYVVTGDKVDEIFRNLGM
jgi:protein-arginine kinase activator protein McsA